MDRLISGRFARSAKYHPDWLVSHASGGACSLWLTEWLVEALDLRPGMRVLDLGCGLAMSSIFLRREFGVQVWATDLWFDATNNLQRIRDADVHDGVFPIHADARSLPFATEFFDAIVSIDSFVYYGTDDLYLNYLARFLKPGGVLIFDDYQWQLHGVAVLPGEAIDAFLHIFRRELTVVEKGSQVAVRKNASPTRERGTVVAPERRLHGCDVHAAENEAGRIVESPRVDDPLRILDGLGAVGQRRHSRIKPLELRLTQPVAERAAALLG